MLAREVEGSAERRSKLVERAITRMARQTSPRPSARGRVLFPLRREREGVEGQDERKEREEASAAIGQPRTRLLHMLSISCSNSTETRRERGNVYRRNDLDDSGSQRPPGTIFFPRPPRLYARISRVLIAQP